MPEFTRCYDIAELNRLLNHPRIRPYLGTDGKSWIDGAPLMGLFYLSDQGGMTFHESEPGLWEGHYLFTERGCFDLALGMVHACVLEARPKMIWGRVPVQNKAGRMFTRKLGFTSLGICERPFPAEIFVWQRRAR